MLARAQIKCQLKFTSVSFVALSYEERMTNCGAGDIGPLTALRITIRNTSASSMVMIGGRVGGFAPTRWRPPLRRYARLWRSDQERAIAIDIWNLHYKLPPPTRRARRSTSRVEHAHGQKMNGRLPAAESRSDLSTRPYDDQFFG